MDSYYLPFIPVLIILYILTVDRNVLDYLHLRLVSTPVLWLQTTIFKYRFLIGLQYDRYRIKRGHIPKRFMDMAQQMREEIDDSGRS